MNADVAFDARITSHMSAGMRTYTNELRMRLPEVAPDLRFEVFGAGDNFDLAEQVTMPSWIAKHKPRLVHYPTPFAPLYNSRPYILTIHDLIELRFPAFSKPKAVRYFRYVTGNLARRAALVICDDERTASDLTSLLRVRSDRIRVVPLGVDEAFFKPHERTERERGYLLYAGNHRAHKDLPTLFAAWSQLPRDCAIDLHLTGVDDFGGSLAAYGRDDARIVLLGNLELPALIHEYCGAHALVHPALVEGFGLPLLEAAALGTPVVAAESSVPAILASGVSTFPPGDVSTLRLILERLMRDPGEFRARAQAAEPVAREYTWDRCAQATAEVYREVLRAA